MSAERVRGLVAFAAAVAVLVGSAIVFASAGDEPSIAVEAEGGAAMIEVPARARRTELWARSVSADVRRAAQRFLIAFSRYEVGEISSAVRSQLRATASGAFASELLRRPPRPGPAQLVEEARLERLRVRFVSADADQALISGNFRRGALPEEFAFLFARRADGWRATGPAE